MTVPLHPNRELLRRHVERTSITPEVARAIREIVQLHHEALVEAVCGGSMLPETVVAQIRAAGIPRWTGPAVVESGVDLGILTAALRDPFQDEDDPDELARRILQRELPLSYAEAVAEQVAKEKAAVYCRGLGNTVDKETQSLIVETTAENRAQLTSAIQDEVAEAIHWRETRFSLKSRLGRATGEWHRDLHRIAETELHNAMQRGRGAAIERGHGEGAQVAKRPNPEACFVPGTPVLTRRGLQPIEAVVVGDQVLTHRFQWKLVTAVHRRLFSGAVFGFSGHAGTTGNHPVLCNGDWTRADSIQVGLDLLYVHPVWVAEYDPPETMKQRLLENIAGPGFPPGMPVSAVEFNSDPDSGKCYVYVVDSNSEFQTRTVLFELFGQDFGFLCGTAARSFSGLGEHRSGFGGDCQDAGLSGVFCECPAPFRRKPADPVIGTGASGSQLYPQFQQTPLDDSAANTEFVRDGLQGQVARPQGEKHILIYLGPSVRHGRPSYKSIVVAEYRAVKDIAFGQYEGVVYNLSVAGDASYVADGIVVHNCDACRELYLDGDGNPRIFRLSEIRDASNARDPRTGKPRKRADWVPTLEALHPHCFLPGTVVQGRIQLGTRAWYSGEAVEILTARGHKLSVTPNHPVPTADGRWLRAGEVAQGDDLLCYLDGKKVDGAIRVVSRPDPRNEQQDPARIEEVFDAFAKGGRRARLHAAPMDFHGDAIGLEGDVDVVWPASVLLRDGLSPVAERGGDLGFPEADVAAVAGGLSGGSSVSQFDRGLDAPAAVIPSAAELPLDRGPIRAQVLPLDVSLLGLASELDTCVAEFGPQGVPSDPRFAGQLLDRFPGLVAPDKVIQVRKFNFSGHVYDLQSETGWIVADGIVTSNCRCQTIRVPEGWGFDEDGRLVPPKRK